MSQTTTQAATRGAWPVERFEAPKQCAGYWVRDPRGRKIGKLKRLFLNGSGGGGYAGGKIGVFAVQKNLHPGQSVFVGAGRRVLAVGGGVLLLPNREAGGWGRGEVFG